METNTEYARNAAEITLSKVYSWDDLNSATEELGSKKFTDKTRELWKDFTVHGVLSINKESGEREFKPLTDLDGECAIEILKLSGLDTTNLTYVRPGEYIEGTINIDTGNKFGMVFDKDSNTVFFDHHGESSQISSATEIIYRTMTELGVLDRTPELDRLVNFVTLVDNKKYPAEEFLRSAKTILGLQREVKFNQLLAYFKEHDSPFDELTLVELDKYGLKEISEKQQHIVDYSMAIMDRMEKEGKTVQSVYGNILINENNELSVGSSAAYVKYDGIVNITPGKSFAITLRDKIFNEEALKARLGDRFQGKIIRGSMWIYNEPTPLLLSKEELIEVIR